MKRCNHPQPDLCQVLGRHIVGGLWLRWNDSAEYRQFLCDDAGVDRREVEERFPPANREDIPVPVTKESNTRRVRHTSVDPPVRGGVGTKLKAILRSKGIVANGSCKCNARASEMDQLGIEWCEENRETIVGWLMEGAAERVWLRPFLTLFSKPAEIAARHLVDEAIQQAKWELPPPRVETIEWDGPTVKNLVYHTWPVKGGWQRHLDRVLASIDQFNGKRLLGIVTDDQTDPADAVKDYVSGHDFEFVVAKNRPRVREGVTFLPMLKMIESTNPNEVTFFGHAKGVRYSDHPGSTIQCWTDLLYRTVYENWDQVREALKTKAMAGSFKRYGSFGTPGNYRWHYSGSFYWFRNRDVFQRHWNRIDQRFFAVESWPGLLFKPEEVACLFFDDVGDLYKLDYWNEFIEPAFEAWDRERLPS